MASSKTVETVRKLVLPVIEEMGLRLWDVRFVKEGAQHYLRIYIDSDKGIDINDCTNVSHAIDPIIDEADPISVSYYLEVCSPGINREIKTKEHFAAVIGKSVLLKTVRPVDGVREFCGTLEEFDKETVTLKTEGESVSFARNNIQSVKLNDEIQSGGTGEND